MPPPKQRVSCVEVGGINGSPLYLHKSYDNLKAAIVTNIMVLASVHGHGIGYLKDEIRNQVGTDSTC